MDTGQGDCVSLGRGGSGRHERSLLTTTQVMVEGRQDVVHAPQRTVCALPDRLHPGPRPPSAPERGSIVVMAQHIPLLGPGFPPWHRACRALAISQ